MTRSLRRAADAPLTPSPQSDFGERYIFAFNDILALGALRAAYERGLRVPGDLSIIGFDDLAMASLVTPALTTVQQPLSEMGRMATGLLGRLLDKQSVDALHVELETNLVVRSSTAPLAE